MRDFRRTPPKLSLRDAVINGRIPLRAAAESDGSAVLAANPDSGGAVQHHLFGHAFEFLGQDTVTHNTPVRGFIRIVRAGHTSPRSCVRAPS